MQRRHPPKTYNVSSIDLAYMAGIIDGEGCISARRRSHRKGKRPNSTPTLAIANTHRGLLEWVTVKFGGNICSPRNQIRRPTHKQIYQWSMEGSCVYDLLRLVLPYLVVKRNQAEVVMEMVEIKDNASPENGGTCAGIGGTGSDYTDHTFDKLDDLWAKIQKLNQRGVSIIDGGIV